jgi:uncharacterized RDD family membrane protein YckC
VPENPSPGQPAAPTMGYPPPQVPAGYPPPQVPTGYPPPQVPTTGYGPPPVYAYLPAPPPLSPGGQRLAEFTDRLLARLIDGLILGAISGVVILPLYFVVFFNMMGPLLVEDPDSVELANPGAFILSMFALAGAIIVLALLLAYLYEVEAMFRTGQTIGKRAMKIQIVPLNPGVQLTRAMAFKRYLIHNVAAAVLPGLQWIDGLWQLWDKPFRQCLHDKYAATVVIKLDA